MSKILITGATGFVGHKLMGMCEGAVASPSIRNATESDLFRIVEESGADVIIHTAAISDVATCQKNPEDSYRANVLLPVSLARAAVGRKLIYFSSDMVYTGNEDEGPYREDYAKPANVYGEHKLEMEERVLDINPEAVMLRAEWMYDYLPGKSNYFMNMLGAKGTVKFSSGNFRGLTYVKEVAQNMENVIKLPGGVYNFGSETTKSMYEITRDFAGKLNLDFTLEDTPPIHNLWIDCSKAAGFGVKFSEVSEGLYCCAKDYLLI
ncbi:MAG: sugar nucleotide-binding protein [Butyrivibrio sp.]|nr:sugar nucleotide-binding protein [Butyrivibrio sp.]